MNFFENSMTINIRFRDLQTVGYIGKRNLKEYIDKKDRLRFQVLSQYYALQSYEQDYQ